MGEEGVRKRVGLKNKIKYLKKKKILAQMMLVDHREIQVFEIK